MFFETNHGFVLVGDAFHAADVMIFKTDVEEGVGKCEGLMLGAERWDVGMVGVFESYGGRVGLVGGEIEWGWAGCECIVGLKGSNLESIPWLCHCGIPSSRGRYLASLDRNIGRTVQDHS